MRRCSTFLVLGAAAAVTALSDVVPSEAASSPVATFSNRLVFKPPSNYTSPRVLYARTVELSDGSLLATWENYSPEPPAVYFPVYRSTDNGSTWAEVSRVTDQTPTAWGLRYQPFLYELPADVGTFKEGTVLCAGNSIPTDLSRTQIDVYASTDKGLTWMFVSHVAAGGKARPDNGQTPVWEPFLLYYNGSIIIYYSDQRDPKHGQKLVHQTSSDLLTWDPAVDDVAVADYKARPGMTTVAALPNGQYIMTYEYGNAPGGGFPVYYRLATDPRAFAAAPAFQLVTGNTRPTSSPYVTWTLFGGGGGSNGTILVSANSHAQLFSNSALGDAAKWTQHSVPQPAAYTRHLRVLRNDPTRLLIMGAGHLPPGTTNTVSLSVVDLEQVLGV
ncbi:Neuraminidase [Niveomyces insectorum RCEF 264]|uniref:Neuraminidase n=1 Tax=Niveomyces insectorum RCEF 264 TaxID=1081102 RepID=A0A167X956_9HYPO|nr:Neuraminidase [Niveomyces insectorum RCEF 264]